MRKNSRNRSAVLHPTYYAEHNGETIMSREFKIERDPYDEKDYIYKRSSITLNPGVTVLVGCNGAGKTTLLRTIRRQLDKEEIPFIEYDNLHDGGANSKSAALFYGNISLAAGLMQSSEGEQISINIGTTASKIGKFVRENRDKPELWILLDAIDSGLSIDNVREIKEGLFATILDDNPNSDVYIIVSANEYEMCIGMNCFDVVNGKYINITSYNSFAKAVLRSREYKDKRYKGE